MVSVSTKSGTNMLHGTAFDYLRNDAFDASNFFVRKIAQPDGTLVKDPVPPLNRNQYGGALGGAVVIPGLYDGHNRTFFFADYSGFKERRGVTTVNTVPTAATRMGDFSDYRDRSGNLIPIYDPLTTRLERRGRVVRDSSPNNIIPADRLSTVGRNLASLYPLPNNGGRPLRQLHFDARSRHHRQRPVSGRIDHRLSDSVVLRPVQLRQVQARRPAGPGQLLPADAARCRGPVRSRTVRRRHSKHAADHARRRVQLLEGAEAEPDQRAAHRLRQHRAVHDAVRLRHNSAVPRHPPASTSTRSRPASPTSTSRTSPGFRVVPTSCPVNPSQFHYQIEDALVWLKGRHSLKVRLPAGGLGRRRPSPTTDTRSSDHLRHEVSLTTR